MATDHMWKPDRGDWSNLQSGCVVSVTIAHLKCNHCLTQHRCVEDSGFALTRSLEGQMMSSTPKWICFYQLQRAVSVTHTVALCQALPEPCCCGAQTYRKCKVNINGNIMNNNSRGEKCTFVQLAQNAKAEATSKTRTEVSYCDINLQNTGNYCFFYTVWKDRKRRHTLQI